VDVGDKRNNLTEQPAAGDMVFRAEHHAHEPTHSQKDD